MSHRGTYDRYSLVNGLASRVHQILTSCNLRLRCLRPFACALWASIETPKQAQLVVPATSDSQRDNFCICPSTAKRRTLTISI